METNQPLNKAEQYLESQRLLEIQKQTPEIKLAELIDKEMENKYSLHTFVIIGKALKYISEHKAALRDDVMEYLQRKKQGTHAGLKYLKNAGLIKAIGRAQRRKTIYQITERGAQLVKQVYDEKQV